MGNYRGDNFQAFDGNPIVVEFETNGMEVSRALFVINSGTIVKEFKNPVSPLSIELNENETKKLNLAKNIANLILFDSQGRKKTCDGTLEFSLNEGVYFES